MIKSIFFIFLAMPFLFGKCSNQGDLHCEEVYRGPSSGEADFNPYTSAFAEEEAGALFVEQAGNFSLALEAYNLDIENPALGTYTITDATLFFEGNIDYELDVYKVNHVEVVDNVYDPFIILRYEVWFSRTGDGPNYDDVRFTGSVQLKKTLDCQ